MHLWRVSKQEKLAWGIAVREVKPPQTDMSPYFGPAVFLAGSIEMGAAVDWQAKATAQLLTVNEAGVILNPRRDDWDSSWEQKISNDQFYEQVLWEQQMIKFSDFVFFNFVAGTQSPITLLEFGQVVEIKKPEQLVICCPDEFWRSGNVQIVAQLSGNHVYKDIDDAITILKRKVQCFTS